MNLCYNWFQCAFVSNQTNNFHQATLNNVNKVLRYINAGIIKGKQNRLNVNIVITTAF